MTLTLARFSSSTSYVKIQTKGNKSHSPWQMNQQVHLHNRGKKGAKQIQVQAVRQQRLSIEHFQRTTARGFPANSSKYLAIREDFSSSLSPPEDDEAAFLAFFPFFPFFAACSRSNETRRKKRQEKNYQVYTKRKERVH